MICSNSKDWIVVSVSYVRKKKKIKNKNSKMNRKICRKLENSIQPSFRNT